MSEKGLFLQNVIALIWDFDRTLSPHYMQRPIFKAYGVDEDRFWKEVNELPAYYRRSQVDVQEDTCYLGHLLSYVRHGKMPGLTNGRLRELGAKIELFPGLPEFFARIHTVLKTPAFEGHDLRIEHYIVSTGLKEMVLGSKIAEHVKDVWGSVFIEEPAGPGTDLSGVPESGSISQIAGFLDNTTKTRAIFEINKGVNTGEGISVNDSIPEEERRVPFENMIYVADGPSDIPSFSVVREHGGLAYAVHDPNSAAQLEQVDVLRATGRVDHYGRADYSEGSDTDLWLRLKVHEIAKRIMEERKNKTKRSLKPGPVHLGDSQSDG